MALKHYEPHGYATRYACGAKVKPGRGSAYSDEVTCQWCLEKLKIAHEFGSLEGDFDIEDDMVGTAKRRYVRETEERTQASDPAEALYTLLGRLPFAPNAILRPSTYKHIKTLIGEFRSANPEQKSVADKLTDVLNGVARQVSKDVKGASTGKLPKFLTDELGGLTQHFKKLVGHDEKSAIRVGEVRQLVREELRLNERRIREAELADGSKSPWGSEAHVKELRASIADLERYRNQQRRGSDARATYTRALQRLKAQLKSAERAAAKSSPKGRTKTRP